MCVRCARRTRNAREASSLLGSISPGAASGDAKEASMADRTLRPVGVTVVAIIAWISGALDLIAGIIMLFLLPVQDVVDSFGGGGPLVAAAIGSIIVGLITVIVAGGLLNGSPGARLVVTVLQILSIIGSLFLAVAYRESPTAITEWIGILVALVVLILLWSRRATAFFSS
jgi:hypothetical protein